MSSDSTTPNGTQCEPHHLQVANQFHSLINWHVLLTCMDLFVEKDANHHLIATHVEIMEKKFAKDRMDGMVWSAIVSFFLYFRVQYNVFNLNLQGESKYRPG